jgi:hypothetical protein
MFHVSTMLPFEMNDPQKVSFKFENWLELSSSKNKLVRERDCFAIEHLIEIETFYFLDYATYALHYWLIFSNSRL